LAVGTTSNGDGRLEVFALSGRDNSVWHRWQTSPGNGWSDWAALLGSGSLDGGEILLNIPHSFGDDSSRMSEEIQTRKLPAEHQDQAWF
jgi:hypothetical protein